MRDVDVGLRAVGDELGFMLQGSQGFGIHGLQLRL